MTTSPRLAIQPDGKIVAVGSAGEDIAPARYTPDGKLDPSFGNGGSKITDLGFADVANGVALTLSGQILIAGDTIAPNGATTSCSRATTSTEPSTPRSAAAAPSRPTSAAPTTSPKTSCRRAGPDRPRGPATSPTFPDIALARYNPDSTLDTSFANNGTLTADFHGLGDFGEDVTIDSQGEDRRRRGYRQRWGTEFALTRANP